MFRQVSDLADSPENVSFRPRKRRRTQHCSAWQNNLQANEGKHDLGVTYGDVLARVSDYGTTSYILEPGSSCLGLGNARVCKDTCQYDEVVLHFQDILQPV